VKALVHQQSQDFPVPAGNSAYALSAEHLFGLLGGLLDFCSVHEQLLGINHSLQSFRNIIYPLVLLLEKN
jgi:hypothetical protein